LKNKIDEMADAITAGVSGPSGQPIYWKNVGIFVDM